MVGITKQAHYKRVKQQGKLAAITQEVISSAFEIRKDHRRMGCRKLYYEIKPEGIGRDRFEDILLSNGFRIKQKKSYHRTTYAGKKWYPNLISGLEVRRVNQLMVSDLTYIFWSKGNYYLTLVLDVYSRKISGWSLSANMTTGETVVPAFKMAVKDLAEEELKGLIFHSDKGSQYSSKEMEKLHNHYLSTPSMGGKAWENAHAESLNGILKNEYVDFRHVDLTLTEARKIIKKVIYLYNDERPHGS
ncbi:transposase [Salinimicrobium marinum]|uniref:Transposase n=1 Tax=Salinimicrobium marinum TaxID=680283 RepID=A0A918VZH1_9FLAO|nr:IS3 family transposase [Salinimicrobium marinum]GHA46342.1 transposase [Salinimicrobium marinum]